jgi:RNA polymerase sigma-70 factor, ECF subfamily
VDDDRALMQRVARRDQQAFTDLVERYAGRLLAVAHRLLRSREDAEDAVQRALLRCYTRAGTYRPEWAVSTWIYQVLTNVCVDELRRRASRNRLAAALPVPQAGSRSSPEVPGRFLDLHRALNRVPERARVLLALRYVDGLSYSELARIRGISENTVKSQLARGKAIVRAALGGRAFSDTAAVGEAAATTRDPAGTARAATTRADARIAGETSAQGADR